jgi:serine/threonine protein kinase
VSAPVAPGYEVLEHLSRGRTLDVYDVWSEERQCRCVAKALRPDRVGERGPRRRLRLEGRLLLAIAHPHIVRAYELIDHPDPVLILETLEGETLEHMIERRRRRLPLVELAFLGLHLCSALHYLHTRGVLHLDLKPSNVVADAGLAKVIDLSIARRPGRIGRGVGTRQYLSPEQARGGRTSPATDVWGIGAVLFEAATGVRPFQGFENGRYQQLERRADPVGSHRRLPAAFAELVGGCLDPAPAGRPALDELAAALAPFAHEG